MAEFPAPGRFPRPRTAGIVACAIGLAALIVENAARETAGATAPPATGGSAAARSRIEADPLDVAALRAYGLALDHDGRSGQAEAVLSFAAMRSWRDIPTLIWLIPHRIAQGDFVSAINEADALMRRDIDNDLRERLIAMMSAAATDNGARPALVARLNAQPWWRASFLPRLAQNGPLEGVRAVLLDMARGPAPASAGESAPYIVRMVQAGRYGQALTDWAALRGRSADARELVRNGDFAGPPDPSVFGWRAAEGVGGESAVEPAPDGRPGLALRVDYDGFSAPTLPRQLLVLPPGRYRLSWWERREPGSPRRLDWAVSCAESGAVISTPGAGDGGATWRQESRLVVTPTSGCGGQWLGLVAAPGERRSPATTWYAHVTVQPLA